MSIPEDKVRIPVPSKYKRELLLNTFRNYRAKVGKTDTANIT